MYRNRILKQLVIVLGMLSLFSGLVYADRDHDNRDRKDWRQSERHERYDRRRDDRAYRVPSKDYRIDRRYDHDRYYPRPGYNIERLPSRHYVVRFRDDRYYFQGGIWYRPYGSRFVVVSPPIGIVVPILPAFYTTIWVGGIPYYYANNVYYVWDPARDGYIVTNPPQDINKQEPALVPDQLYIYPKHGQSAQKQADDRFACYQWSVKQTGFDPTQAPQGIDQQDLNHKREDYQKAMRACLEGRGYSVR